MSDFTQLMEEKVMFQARYVKLKSELDRLRSKWINAYYKGHSHIDVTECADELGDLLEDFSE